MSRFQHTICEECWAVEEPHRNPVRIKEQYREPAVCCFCGKAHLSGIFIRKEPDNTPCRGEHEPELPPDTVTKQVKNVSGHDLRPGAAVYWIKDVVVPHNLACILCGVSAECHNMTDPPMAPTFKLPHRYFPYREDGYMVIIGACNQCRKRTEVTVRATDYRHWLEGTMIQRAFPYLTPDEREILISGICGICFDRMFKE